MRSVSFSGWLAAAASVGLCHCALDDRSPVSVEAPNQPGAGGVAGASAGPGMGVFAAGSGGDASSSGSSGSPPGSGSAGSGGVASGMRPGSGGMSNVAGMASAGSTGNTGGPPTGSAGASSAGATGSEGGPAPIDLGGVSAPVVAGVCPAFTPCGGDLVGNWVYIEACPTTDIPGGLPCSPTAAYEAGAAASLSFSEGQVLRSGSPVGDGVVTFPADCGVSCTIIGPIVGGAGQCADVGADCVCRTPFSIDWGQQTYSVSGTQLTLSGGRTFEYCVDGARLTYRETGSADEPGVFTLQRN